MSSLLFKLLAGKGAISEAIKTFRLNLSNPSGGATLAKSFGTGTIQQNPILLNVAVSRASGKAPLSIGFDATGTTSALTVNPSHDIYYIWDFGDDKSETFTRGATPGQNMNVSYGDVAGHVYKTAGTYTWNVTAIDGNGNVQTKSGSVTVSDWALADTYWVANGAVPVAGVNGVPVGAVNCSNQTTWAGVVALWAANKRVMLKRGDSWDCLGTTSLQSGVEVNAFGAGAAPVVNSVDANRTPFLINNNFDDVRIVGIKHAGPGEAFGDSGMIHMTATASSLLVMDCIAQGSTWGVLSSVTCSEVFIQNCDFLGAVVTEGAGLPTNISVYLTATYGLCLLGNNFDGATSHLVRLSGVQRSVVDSNRFRRCDVNAVGRDAITIRGFDGAPPEAYGGAYTQHNIVSNNDFDMSDVPTATLIVQSKPWSTIADARFRYLLVERNFVISQGSPYEFRNQEFLTVRNNIGICTGARGVPMISLADSAIGYSPLSTDISVYNNTLYQIGSTGSAFGVVVVDNTVSNVRIKNNLFYAPNHTTVTAVDSGLAVGVVQSNNSTDTQVRTIRPWASASPVAPIDFTPSGSYAVDGGAALANVQRDFFQQQITGAREIGAIQI